MILKYTFEIIPCIRKCSMLQPTCFSFCRQLWLISGVFSVLLDSNAVLAGALEATTNKLQRVLNAAAHVVSVNHKFDRGLSRLLHTELHWLDVPERVVYQLGVIVFNCLHGQAPLYLVELCQPVAGVASWQHLWSSTRQLLVVPHHRLRFCGRLAFSVTGPSVWNSLPDSLRNPTIGGDSFRQSLKTFLFATYWCIERIRGFTTMHCMNRLFLLSFTYLLPYLKLTHRYRTSIFVVHFTHPRASCGPREL